MQILLEIFGIHRSKLEILSVYQMQAKALKNVLENKHIRSVVINPCTVSSHRVTTMVRFVMGNLSSIISEDLKSSNDLFSHMH